MEAKIRVLNATIEIFNEKGLKFTMDDIAAKLGMSKKTIYTIFKDKEELFFEMVDYIFCSVKEGEKKIMENPDFTTIERIKAVLGVMPEKYQDIDFRKLYQLKDKYPKIYEEVERRLETGWENTIALLEQGIAEGVIRPIKIPVLKTMFEAVLEQFFRRDVLVVNEISYQEALEEVVNILIDGITVR
ncbi:MAG: TetR/AcrR family transcriptional regulator [Lachnospiraceae bacterium]|nr:TetR/AcrR family transcriptional regulator [Lachnospiraceae bacterium]